MILIVESGSTKANWLLIDGNHQYPIQQTIGLNPFFITQQDIESAFLSLNLNADFIFEVYFYGAGCSNKEKCAFIKNGLQPFLHKAHIDVHSDLLAAARATFKQQDGIVGILGTGSNAATFVGGEFTDKIVSLGYILGDQGSGNYIGKKILQAYFNGEFNHELEQVLEKDYNVTHPAVLNNIYKESFPNRYLARFAKFAGEYKSEAVIKPILSRSFDDYFEYFIMKLSNYQEYPIGLVGSVAFHFKDEIMDSALRQGLLIEKIIKDPIQGLAEFHIK